MERKKAVILVLVVLFLITFFFQTYTFLQLPSGHSKITGWAATTDTGQLSLCFNAPPQITSIPDQLADSTNFTYQVVATDSNSGATLTYYDNTSLFNITSTSGLINFTPSYTNNGLHNISITIDDNSGCTNSNATTSFSLNISLSTPSSPEEESPTGGAVKRAAAEAVVEPLVEQLFQQSWDFLLPEETIKIETEETTLAIIEVIFQVKQKVLGAWLKIEDLSRLPETVGPFPFKVYRYIRLTEGNLQKNLQGQITVKFRVDKQWLTEKNLVETNLALFHYQENKWNELPTLLENKDSDYVYYSSQTPSFSYFIIGESPPLLLPAEPAEETPSSTVTFFKRIPLATGQAWQQLGEVLLDYSTLWIVVVSAILIIIIFFLLIRLPVFARLLHKLIKPSHLRAKASQPPPKPQKHRQPPQKPKKKIKIIRPFLRSLGFLKTPGEKALIKEKKEQKEKEKLHIERKAEREKIQKQQQAELQEHQEQLERKKHQVKIETKIKKQERLEEKREQLIEAAEDLKQKIPKKKTPLFRPFLRSLGLIKTRKEKAALRKQQKLEEKEKLRLQRRATRERIKARREEERLQKEKQRQQELEEKKRKESEILKEKKPQAPSHPKPKKKTSLLKPFLRRLGFIKTTKQKAALQKQKELTQKKRLRLQRKPKQEKIETKKKEDKTGKPPKENKKQIQQKNQEAAKQLSQYISSMLKEGSSPQQIEKSLLAKGWPKKIVKDYLSSFTKN